MASPNDDSDEMITTINVTPLVDVALVLLVILMVTATYIAARAIVVDLPRAETGEGTSTTLAISIDASGGLWLDGRRIEQRALRARIRAVRRTRPGARALIAADGAARHRSVVSVIDLLRTEGINEFAINVQPSELAHDG